MRAAPIAALLLCAGFASAERVQAKGCSAQAACGNTSQDVVELRDGRALCGTILFRDEGHSLIIIDGAHQNLTLPWDEISCVDQHAGDAVEAEASEPVEPSEAPRATAPASAEADVGSTDDEESERGVWLDWDVRFAGTSFWKRYVQRDAAAWSWGMSGGVAFGATLHYAVGVAGSTAAIRWSDLEVGLSGTVTYGSWHQINAGDASLIEQDFSLRLGARFRLGGPLSGVVAGISWLPTYVDFYGRQIKTPGTIQPLGVRVTLDLGDVHGAYRHATIFRIALAYLPYFGRLPSMFGLSVGIALD